MSRSSEEATRDDMTKEEYIEVLEWYARQGGYSQKQEDVGYASEETQARARAKSETSQARARANKGSVAAPAGTVQRKRVVKPSKKIEPRGTVALDLFFNKPQFNRDFSKPQVNRDFKNDEESEVKKEEESQVKKEEESEVEKESVMTDAIVVHTEESAASSTLAELPLLRRLAVCELDDLTCVLHQDEEIQARARGAETQQKQWSSNGIERQGLKRARPSELSPDPFCAALPPM